MKKLYLILAVMFAFVANAQQKSFYDFTVKTIDGKEFALASLKGKKVLVVNVASKCGLTPQYAQLQQLYDLYRDRNFVIIGFPANNFGAQEPGTNAEIKEFCTLNYGVTFPVMEKISVKGADIHPLYQWLTQKSQNGKQDAEVTWNFQKFLIDEKGNWVKSLPPATPVMSKDIILWLKNEQKSLNVSGNPVFEGWYADPEGIVYGKNYWIFPTYSDEYKKQVFFDCFSSPDLVNWTKHEKILDTAAVKWAKIAMWAPAVIEKNGKYYLFFGANDVHEGEIGGIGVAVADRPEGKYKDLIGKPLINEIVNGAQPIDQFVFRDGNSYYMYYGGWGHCNVVKLNDDFTALVPFEDGTVYREITPQNYTEGPFVFKRNGKYYFMWSEGGWGNPDYSVAYAISDSPFGPFERIGKVLQQDSNVATSAGHHSVIHVPNSNDYYIVYHRRPLGERHHNHRQTCIEKMEFDKNGNILPVKITFEGVSARKIKY